MFNIQSERLGDSAVSSIIDFMILYAGFIFVLFVIMSFRNKKNKIGFIDILVLIILVVVAAIRYDVGVDYLAYYKYYNTIYMMYSSFGQGFELSNMPYIMYAIYYMGRTIWDNPFGFFWITSVIIYPIIFLTIVKRSEKPAISFLLFCMMGFLGNSLNIIKQWLATAILFYGLKYVQTNKWVIYAILFLIALGFHQMSIVFALLVILAKLFVQPNKKWYMIMIAIGVILVLLFLVLPLVVRYIPVINTDRFLKYFQDDTTGYSSTLYAKIAMVGYCVCYLPLIHIVIRNAKELIEKNPDNKLYINMLLISIPFMILALRKRFAFRIAMFLDLPIVFLLPLIPSFAKNKKGKNSITIIISAIVVVFFVVYTVFNKDIFYNYSTYFNVM